MGDALSQPGALYDTYAPRIFRYIYHRLGDQSLAQDLTSEVFCRFLAARAKPDNVAAFLYRIAHNLIVDQLRRRRPDEPLDEAMPSESPDPLLLAQVEFERAQVRRALNRLTPEQQQVIVLKFLEGLENGEIAEIVGKPVGAVKSLQHRALETLRDLFAAPARRAEQVKEANK